MEIPLEQKQAFLTKLEEDDKSDWLDNTKKVCEASHHENKSRLWRMYFDLSEGAEIESWGLYHF